MAKLNANYEAVFIIDPRKNEEDTAALVEKFKTLAETNATSVEVDEWGKKRLAYEIQKMKEGFYYFIRFDAEPTAPVEIESRVRIMDNVIRYLVVRQDEA